MKSVRPAIGSVLDSCAQATATCPLGHVWFTDYKVIHRGYTSTPAGRARPVHDRVMSQERCPECGSKWGTLKPGLAMG